MGDKILKGENLTVPVPEISLGEFFFELGEKHKELICQVDGTSDKTETFGSVKERSIRVALQLQQKGVKQDDVIAFCSSNTLDYTIPILASFYLGAKVANLEPSLSVRHTKHLLHLTTPKVIFVEDSSINLIEDSLKDTNFETEIIVFGKSSKYSLFSDLVKSHPNEDTFRPIKVNIHDVAVLFFSSGTTGLPKAICHSHFTFLYSTAQFRQVIIGNVFLHLTTFYWVSAMEMLTLSYMTGGYRVFFRNPSAEDIFSAIEKYKITDIFVAPILTYKLTRAENVKNYDISSVKLFLTGGTPLAQSQFQKTKNLFKNALTSLCYGMTEIGFISSFTSKESDEFLNKKSESCGKLSPEISLKVVDLESNQSLGPNQQGEFRLKSPSMMKGYYKLDSSDVFDEEGFLKTGDIGYYDEDGCLYLIERIKEMFKYQSWHIIPSAIETVLHEHPCIKEAVVFGIPREEEGEVPAACIVLHEGSSDVSEEEIETFLAERVADREKLRGGIKFVQSLPRTPTSKVIRRDVRDFFMKNI